MTDDEFLPDDVDALLTKRAENDGRALREALRGPLTAAFVRRHRRRRVRRAMSMAACYALGIATIYAWQQVSASPVERGPATATKVEETPVAAEVVTKPPKVSPEIVAVESRDSAAPRAPVVAKQVKKSRFDALRELGDYHLHDRNPEQALRCYRVALRFATEEEFTAAAHEGSWLLRAVCLDTKQEKDHAPEKT